jgi:hypothetical protein
LPDHAEALRKFQPEIVRRMIEEVSMAEKPKLLDLLHVEASWDSRSKQLTVSGLIGDTLLDMSR